MKGDSASDKHCCIASPKQDTTGSGGITSSSALSVVSQKSTKPQVAIKVFSSLLRTTLLAPPIAATTFLLAWYTRETFGGVSEAFGLFWAMFMVMMVINVMLTLLLLLSGEIVRRFIPSMGIHTMWRVLLFGITGGIIAAGMILLLLQWLPSGSEVFSVAMVSGIVGGVVTGLATESMV